MSEFWMDEEQKAKLKTWIAPHEKERMGSIGGRFTYSFTPTSLGVILKVKCACGEEVDLTDYGSW